MDVLGYPSCKLYDDGRFRLPNQVRKNLQSQRIQKVVLIPDKLNKIILLPVSQWERNKNFFQENNPIKYPVRPQSVDASLLRLHPKLIDYLPETEYLFFEELEKQYLIWLEKDYWHKNNKWLENIKNQYSNFG